MSGELARLNEHHAQGIRVIRPFVSFVIQVLVLCSRTVGWETCPTDFAVAPVNRRLLLSEMLFHDTIAPDSTANHTTRSEETPDEA